MSRLMDKLNEHRKNNPVKEKTGGILPPFQDPPIMVQVEGNIYRQVQNGVLYVRYLDEKNNIQYKEISEQSPKAKAALALVQPRQVPAEKADKAEKQWRFL